MPSQNQSTACDKTIVVFSRQLQSGKTLTYQISTQDTPSGRGDFFIDGEYKRKIMCTGMQKISEILDAKHPPREDTRKVLEMGLGKGFDYIWDMYGHNIFLTQAELDQMTAAQKRTQDNRAADFNTLLVLVGSCQNYYMDNGWDDDDAVLYVNKFAASHGIKLTGDQFSLVVKKLRGINSPLIALAKTHGRQSSVSRQTGELYELDAHLADDIMRTAIQQVIASDLKKPLADVINPAYAKYTPEELAKLEREYDNIQNEGFNDGYNPYRDNLYVSAPTKSN